MIKPTDTEDKLSYCEFGVVKEGEFLQKIVPLLGLDIKLNPEKETNKYAPDLLYNGELADLKTQLVPFFTASRYKQDPQYSVTINRKDLVRYWKLYRDITIFFWVNFQEESRYGTTVEKFSGVWKANLNELQELKKEGRLPLHTYINRVNDKAGNARDSYILDLRDISLVKEL